MMAREMVCCNNKIGITPHMAKANGLKIVWRNPEEIPTKRAEDEWDDALSEGSEQRISPIWHGAK